jgi:hypothetical protein
VGRYRRPVGRPWRPVGRSRHLVGRSRHPVGRSRRPVGRPWRPVGRSRHPVGRSRRPVGRSRHLVGRPWHPVGLVGLVGRLWRPGARPGLREAHPGPPLLLLPTPLLSAVFTWLDQTSHSRFRRACSLTKRLAELPQSAVYSVDLLHLPPGTINARPRRVKNFPARGVVRFLDDAAVNTIHVVASNCTSVDFTSYPNLTDLEFGTELLSNLNLPPRLERLSAQVVSEAGILEALRLPTSMRILRVAVVAHDFSNTFLTRLPLLESLQLGGNVPLSLLRMLQPHCPNLQSVWSRIQLDHVGHSIGGEPFTRMRHVAIDNNNRSDPLVWESIFPHLESAELDCPSGNVPVLTSLRRVKLGSMSWCGGLHKNFPNATHIEVQWTLNDEPPPLRIPTLTHVTLTPPWMAQWGHPIPISALWRYVAFRSVKLAADSLLHPTGITELHLGSHNDNAYLSDYSSLKFLANCGEVTRLGWYRPSRVPELIAELIRPDILPRLRTLYLEDGDRDEHKEARCILLASRPGLSIVALDGSLSTL